MERRGGSTCTKTAPHKQRKALWGWAQKKENPEGSTVAKAEFLPRCPACVDLCVVFAGRVRKHPSLPYQPLFDRFLRCVWKGGIFQVFVGHPGLGEIEIPYTNPLHLTSSMAHPKEWFLPENGGDTWGRK